MYIFLNDIVFAYTWLYFDNLVYYNPLRIQINLLVTTFHQIYCWHNPLYEVLISLWLWLSDMSINDLILHVSEYFIFAGPDPNRFLDLIHMVLEHYNSNDITSVA